MKGAESMVREIMKDPLFLSVKSADATRADIPAAMDLLETLNAHRHECIGMAANMIGVSKRIIVYVDQISGQPQLMLNPVITAKSKPYDTEEGCLSLPGVRPTVRYEKITVEYFDLAFKKHKGTFTGLTAQIIQHEIDMTNGILI
jgi:peptide deformylase